MEPILAVKHLTKRFGDFIAVNDISFSIKEGEIVGLLGPNGAGKSTTIFMLLDLTTPTSGDIRVLGMNYADDREKILSRINYSSTYI
ncbi:MAG: ABC-type multidrug transport system, ATPase component, partial [Candidatus Gottesmanbacteria bacterium GW2011_GWA1_48_13]